MLNFSQLFASIAEWARRRQQSLPHKATLAAYKEGVFDYPLATIGLGDALEQKLFDPQYLQGDLLVQMAASLDARVWDAWNKSSAHRLDAYMHFYGVDEEQLKTRLPSIYNTLLPFDSIIQIADEEDGLVLLKWLHSLETPWRTFEWNPARLVGRNREVGQWALDTFPTLNLTPGQSECLVRHFLWHELRIPTSNEQPKWLLWIYKDAFNISGWSDDSREQQQAKAYAQRVLDVLLPPARWDWRRRWESFGKGMSCAMAKTRTDQARFSAFRGTMVAALLHEAPVEIQMILCGFKRGRHPDEPSQGDPDAQFVRNHFFAENISVDSPSAIVAAAFLFIDGVDPDVEVGFLLDQLTRGANTLPEVFSLDGLDIVP